MTFEKYKQIVKGRRLVEWAVLVDVRKHGEVPWAAVFSPDGQRIVTVTSDATPRVFRVVTLSEIADLLAK